MVSNHYLDYAIAKLVELKNAEVDNLEKAADLVVDTCKKGGRFYVFGSGHSHIVAEDIYIRAGGLAYVKAILVPELMLHEMPNKSTYIERLEGYSEEILKLYKVDENDTIMIVSNSGRNNVVVEMALYAKELGAHVIAMTSLQHSKEVSSRHNSGKNLYEIADITIDNHADKGDAAFEIEGFNVPVGPTSSITGTALAQALIASVVSKLTKLKLETPVFRSSNLDGADDYNNELFDKYYGYWKW